MKTFFKKISLESKKQFEILDVTEQVRHAVSESMVKSGIAVVYSPHTTAAIRLNHNEPLLIQDLMKTMYRLVPIDISYSHDLFEVRQQVAPNERSNGHAHIKTFLMGSSQEVIIEQGNMLLGGKQSLFFLEFDGGRNREIWVKIIGE